MFCTSTGLPVVLPPAKDEVLGSWLMRIAQFYGLSLNALLSRVGATNPRSGSLPHWIALRPCILDMAPLASALRVQPRQLSTMAPPRCRPLTVMFPEPMLIRARSGPARTVSFGWNAPGAAASPSA